MVDADKVMQIVDMYGTKRQRYKSVEELSELMTLVVQDANEPGKVPVESIIEEIADVYIILKELQLIYLIRDDDIRPWIDHKLNRTIARCKRSEDWEIEAKAVIGHGE